MTKIAGSGLLTDVSSRNFGFLIAYVIPGSLLIWTASEYSATIESWIAVDPTHAPTVGGFLYVTVASVGAGMTASAVRWLLIDTVHHWTGIRQPPWDFSKLQENIAAYDVLNQFHYQYYQFYSNFLVASTFAYVARKTTQPLGTIGWVDLGFLLLAVVFFVTSRDNLRKYYARVGELLGTVEEIKAEGNQSET